jgi:hypothetical protein
VPFLCCDLAGRAAFAKVQKGGWGRDGRVGDQRKGCIETAMQGGGKHGNE